MRDISPLSERFDLRYIRRRRFPDTWTRAATLGAVIAVGGYVGAREWAGDQTLFTSGPLTTAHAIFANDCAKCHQPAEAPAGASLSARAGARYWLPARDEACLGCHVAPTHNPHQSMFTGAERAVSGLAAPVRMSSDCRACHVEHRGSDANLSAVSDSHCTQCHADIGAFGRGSAK